MTSAIVDLPTLMPSKPMPSLTMIGFSGSLGLSVAALGLSLA
jgi:hypothetical protein